MFYLGHNCEICLTEDSIPPLPTGQYTMATPIAVPATVVQSPPFAQPQFIQPQYVQVQQPVVQQPPTISVQQVEARTAQVSYVMQIN